MKKESLDALGAKEVLIVEAEIVPNVPVVVHEGRYRLYSNPDGGMRIQYRRDDKDEDDFVQMPGPIVALAKAAAEGELSPIELVRRMMSIMAEMRKQ